MREEERSSCKQKNSGMSACTCMHVRSGRKVNLCALIIKERMNIFKKASFYLIFFILFEFLFLTTSSFSFQMIPDPEKQEEPLPSLFLIGVVISKDTYSSLAILKNEQTGKTNIVRTGESFFGMKLIQVLENRIILQKNEKTFQIFLGRGNLTSIEEKLQKNQGEVSRAEQKEDLLIGNQLNNSLITKEFNRAEIEKRIEAEREMILKETRFTPNLVKGKISGFKITKLPTRSILSDIGIHKNDIIKEINGIELNDVEKLFTLYNKFKDETQFEVIVERNGKLIRLFYILK